MDVIEFIENDARRSKKKPLWLCLCFAGGALALPPALGLLLRESLEGSLEPRIFLPNLAAAALLACVAWAGFSRNYSSNRAFQLSLLILAFGLFLATERVFFPIGARTSYAEPAVLWRENLRCFTKGGSATLVSGIWLCSFAFIACSWPSRRWRAAISLTAGVSGAVMLGFHCDSSNLGHVLLSHVGQGLVLGGLVFGIQEWIVYHGLSSRFPVLGAKLRNFWKLS